MQNPAQKEARRLTNPSGAQTLTACLIVKNTGNAIQFYKKAFGAKELLRIEAPQGIVGHAELRIGTLSVMLAEEFPDMNT
jgi:PhnB protein